MELVRLNILNESDLAGFISTSPRSDADQSPISKKDPSPYHGDGSLLPHIQELESVGSAGDGDGKLQAFQRLCLTKDPDNLVPVCISASHVAFASYRMEPQYMIVGQSAGVATALTIESQHSIHTIDVVYLQKKLVEQAQVIFGIPKEFVKTQHLALQLHRNDKLPIRFKDIWIRKL